MATTTKAFGLFGKNLAMGRIPWKAAGGAALKMALLLDTYTPNQDTHELWGDVSSHEVSDSGTGYTAGGAAVTLSDPTYTADGNLVVCDCTDAQWAALTLTARYAILYVTSATESERYLVGYCDFGENKSPNAEPFTVKIGANGAINITVA